MGFRQIRDDRSRPGIYNTLKRSPDGRYVVAQVAGPSSSLWLLDTRTAVAKRVATEGNNSFPNWSHDSAVLYYIYDRRKRRELWQQRADGPGDARPVFSDEMAAQLDHPMVWNPAASPDGRYLVYTVSSSSADLWIHEIGGAGGERFLMNLPAASMSDFTSISVVTNWFEELERLVPVD